MGIVVLLGNIAPIGVEGNSVTTFVIPDGVGTIEALTTVVDVYNPYHSDDPPEWVESSSSALAETLAEHYTYGEEERFKIDRRDYDEDGNLLVDEDGNPAPETTQTALPAHECVVGRPDGWEGAGTDRTLENPL